METAEANIPDTSTWTNNTADSAQMTRKPHPFSHAMITHPYGHTHPPLVTTAELPIVDILKRGQPLTKGQRRPCTCHATRAHAAQPVHMPCNPCTCRATRAHAAQPVHMPCNPCTCHATSAHATQPVHMLRNPCTCHATRAHGTQPVHMAYWYGK